MLYDWNNKVEALNNGITEDQLFGTPRIRFHAENGSVKNHTFRNFPRLEFEEDMLITDCIFENCGSIIFDECRVDSCAFSHLDTIFLTNSVVSNCKFTDLSCDNDTLISLEASKIHHCAFDKIYLTNEAFLCDGVGDCWIDHCSFTNIQTDRQDHELVNCEEITGKIFKKKKKKFCIIDEDTCTGIPWIPEILSALPAFNALI